MTRGPTARWRAMLASPAADHVQLVVVIGCALLAIAALAILALDDNVPAPRKHVAPAASPKPTVVPATTATTLDRGPSPSTLRDAKRVATRFVRGYLAYSYGHLPAENLPAATDELKARLGPVRVPARVRQRDPRVLALTTEDGATSRRTAFNATIHDGRRDPYAVRVLLELTAGGWRAVEVG